MTLKNIKQKVRFLDRSLNVPNIEYWFKY